jgi:hypothetical protein
MDDHFIQNDSTLAFITQYKQLKECGIIATDKDFSNQIGWNASALSLVLSGSRNVPQWVAREFARIYKKDNDQVLSPPGDMVLVVDDMKEGEWVMLVPATMHEKYAQMCADPGFIKTLPRMVFLPSPEPINLRAFEVASDLMEPLLYRGDIVTAYYHPRHLWKADGEVSLYYADTDLPMVVVLNNQILIARYEGYADNIFSYSYDKTGARGSISTEIVKEAWIIRSITTRRVNKKEDRVKLLEDRVDALLNILNKINTPPQP